MSDALSLGPWDDKAKRGAIFLPIVGESHHQPTLTSCLAEHPDRMFQAFLEREPDNPYDPHAVALKTSGGDTLGYLDRARAIEFGKAMASFEGRLAVHAELRGGEGAHPFMGVVFDGQRLIAKKSAILGRATKRRERARESRVRVLEPFASSAAPPRAQPTTTARALPTRRQLTTRALLVLLALAGLIYLTLR